jgi:hypothetical protein
VHLKHDNNIPALVGSQQGRGLAIELIAKHKNQFSDAHACFRL